MEALFELLKIGIGKKESLTKGIKSDEWKDIFKVSQRHGITSIVLDGINKCYDQGIQLDIDFKIKMDWIGITQLMEQANKVHEKAMFDLSMLIREYGIRMMVLKGYGLALNYPLPEHRPSGDLDIWCYGKE